MILATIGMLPPPPRRSAVNDVIVFDEDLNGGAIGNDPARALRAIEVSDPGRTFTIGAPSVRSDYVHNNSARKKVLEAMTYLPFPERPLRADRIASDSSMARKQREKRAHAKTRKAERQRRKSNRR